MANLTKEGPLITSLLPSATLLPWWNTLGSGFPSRSFEWSGFIGKQLINTLFKQPCYVKNFLR